MIVDSSALLAVLLNEPEAKRMSLAIFSDESHDFGSDFA